MILYHEFVIDKIMDMINFTSQDYVWTQDHAIHSGV